MKRISDKQLAESAPYRKAHPRLTFFTDEQVDSMAAELIESRSRLARAQTRQTSERDVGGTQAIRTAGRRGGEMNDVLGNPVQADCWYWARPKPGHGADPGEGIIGAGRLRIDRDVIEGKVYWLDVCCISNEATNLLLYPCLPPEFPEPTP